MSEDNLQKIRERLTESLPELQKHFEHQRLNTELYYSFVSYINIIAANNQINLDFSTIMPWYDADREVMMIKYHDKDVDKEGIIYVACDYRFPHFF